MSRLTDALISNALNKQSPPKYMTVRGREGTMYLRKDDAGIYQQISQSEWDAVFDRSKNEKASEQAQGAVSDQQTE